MKTKYYMHAKLNIPNLGYGFFTRNGGFLNDNYATLNCNQNTEGDKNILHKNISIAKKN